MPESHKAEKKRIQKANREAGIGDESGRIVRVKDEKPKGRCTVCQQEIVFTRTKHGANRLVKQLAQVGIEAAAIHGNKSQNARNRAMNGFRSGEIPILVATDIASRGIDVDGVTHVFNFDLPNEPESYVHRIGRTARAGKSGVAIAFCDESEGAYLRDIERLTGVTLTVDEEHAYHEPAAVPPPAQPRRARRSSPPKQSGPNERNARPRRRRRRRRSGGSGNAH